MSASTKGITSVTRSLTTDDGVDLHYREWTPAHSKAGVVCLHGIRSHAAWYAESCAYLCRHGYRVFFPDRRGSGINREKGNERPAAARWIADAEAFVKMAASSLRGAPVHIIGISWGGRLAAAVAARGDAPVSSLVLSAPGLVSLRDFSPRKKLAVLFSLLFRPHRTFRLPLEDPALFTDDPDEMNYIEEDGLGLRRVTPRFLLESRKLERLARRRMGDINIPTLLLLAGRDMIVDNAAVKKLFELLRSTDKMVKVYPEARHTLEFAACRRRYFTDLVQWLDKHSP